MCCMMRYKVWSSYLLSVACVACTRLTLLTQTHRLVALPYSPVAVGSTEHYQPGAEIALPHACKVVDTA